MTTQVITIDGGVGVGGSTTAEALGQALDCDHLNIGEIFRAFTLELADRGWGREQVAANPVGAANLVASFTLEIAKGSVTRVNNRNCEGTLHAPEISKLVPTVAAIPEIRTTAKKIQAGFIASRPLSIIEGRAWAWSIPESVVKIWLHCSPEIAAQRRGCSVAEVLERNQADASRQHSPMVQHPDAISIDTGRLSTEEIVQQIVHAYFGLL